MGNLLFPITLGVILYFLYGSLIFWSVGIASIILFISLMFIDIESNPNKSIKSV